MKNKRFRILLAVLLVGALVVIAWQVSRPREPMYQGKSASAWINSLENNPEQEHWLMLGTNAIPLLIAALERRNGPVEKAYWKLLPRLPWWLRKRVQAPVNAERVRYVAAEDLRWFGKEAKVGVPALIRALDDESPGVRMIAAGTLGGLSTNDRQIVQILDRAMSNPDKVVRGNIVGCLGNCELPGAATSLLLKALNDSDPDVRTIAAVSLLRNEPQVAIGAGVVPIILSNLNRTNGPSFTYSYRIAILKQTAKLVTPALVEALGDREAEIRKAATNALKAIDPEAAAKAGVK